MSIPQFLIDPPRFLFFTGKGGVGKTSIASASAVHLADAGKRVLIVSTDPASNISQVFGQSVGHTVRAIETVPGLSALEIDPQTAVTDYRERILAPLRGTGDPDSYRQVEESLAGACTTEIASFNEFTSLLTQPGEIFDHVIFDTAPTGHTLRLLQLPGQWSGFLQRGKGNASCLGPLAGLEKQQAEYTMAVANLADPHLTRLVLVTRPQSGSLQEAARTCDELSALNLTNISLVVNGLLEDAGIDPIANSIVDRQSNALADLPHNLRQLPMHVIPLKPNNLIGASCLRAMFAEVTCAPPRGQSAPEHVKYPGVPALIEDLREQDSGLIMLMGKGGVGKTTLAAAVAIALADAGKRVHLTTTDPAAHVALTVGSDIAVPNLTVSRIDPHAELENYSRSVLATRGKNMSPEELAALEEDLRSPCYEEIAVFQAFSRVIREARNSIVVVDTAPTGHTLLLLDTTGAYHHEITRGMGGGRFQTPLMRLQDAESTRVMLVTLPEPTPIQEAVDLQHDLNRAGITPWAWIVNNTLPPTSHEILQQRAEREAPLIESVVQHHAQRVAVVPMQSQEPIGTDALRSLASVGVPQH